MRLFAFTTFALLAASTAEAFVVDFSQTTAGSVPGSIVVGGVTISISAVSNTNEVRVLDTTSASPTTGSGNDPDLLGPFDSALDGDLITDRSFGNAVIIQELGTAPGEIDDEGAGGSMFLTFSEEITLGDFFMLDTDSIVRIYLDGSTTAVASGQTSLHGLPYEGPNQYLPLNINQTASSVEIVFASSGALGEFDFELLDMSTSVPLPAGVVLLGSALATAALARRRKLAA